MGVIPVPPATKPKFKVRKCLFKTRQEKKGKDKTRQDKARQGKARQGKTRQGKTRHGKTTQDNARQHKTTQDNIRQHKTSKQDKTRQGKATRQDLAWWAEDNRAETSPPHERKIALCPCDVTTISEGKLQGKARHHKTRQHKTI
jgi:hypothetical protein